MQKFRRFALVLMMGYWAAICYLTHTPRPPHLDAEMGDKTAHFLGYGVLAALLYLTLWAIWPRLKWIPLIVVAVALGYGAIDEWTQPLAGRTCSFADWVADLIGTLLGVTVMGVMHLLTGLRAGQSARRQGLGVVMLQAKRAE